MRSKQPHGGGGDPYVNRAGQVPALTEEPHADLVQGTRSKMRGHRDPGIPAPVPRRDIPRTVETCERYLDRLALVIQRAGPNGAVYLPLVRRLERELAEAREDEEILQRLQSRLNKIPPPAQRR